MRREAGKRSQGAPEVSGYAIRTPLAFIEEESGRHLPFLVCAEKQDSAGWWVNEETAAKGIADCPRFDFAEDGTQVPHPRHRVISFEEALWMGIVDTKGGSPSFGWDQLMEQVRGYRGTGPRPVLREAAG